MLPDDVRHGTQAGRSQHYRDGEDPCDACLLGDAIAGRRRRKRASMGHSHTVEIDSRILDKLLALRAKGASYEQVAEWSGVEFHSIYGILNGQFARVHAKNYRRLAEFQAPPFVTPVGMTRRVQALQALGYSLPKIGAAMGGLSYPRLAAIRDGRIEYAKHDVRRRLAAAYEVLSMSPAPSGTVSERKSSTRARSIARANGWPPPLAWDDIDDPNETPKGTEREPSFWSRDDLVAEWDHLRAAGVSIHAAAGQLGVTVGAIEKACERARKGEAA